MNVPAIPVPLRSRRCTPRKSTAPSTGCCCACCCWPMRRSDAATASLALMISIYPITRFLIESLRSDEAAIFGTRHEHLAERQHSSPRVRRPVALHSLRAEGNTPGCRTRATQRHKAHQKMPQKRPRQTDAK